MRQVVLGAIRKIVGVARRYAAGFEITDEYVKWLCFANAGMLDRGNLYCFDLAIRNLPSDAPMVEIGSFCGLSTNLIAHYKYKHGKTNTLITWLPCR